MPARWQDHILAGTHAARPLVGAVPVGALYSCSDHNLIYRSDGTVWITWAASGVAPTTFLLAGDHASLPAVGTVPAGALYSCSDHDLIYKSNGVAWVTWATMGAGGGGGGALNVAKYQVTHASLTAAALTETLVLTALPAGALVHAVIPIVTTPFSGGTVSAITASVGIPEATRTNLLADPALKAHWSLDEVSGTRLDTTANNHDLTDNNTVTQVAGKIGSAAEFVAANSEYLSVADSAALSMNGKSFTIVAWVKPTTSPAEADIVSKRAAAGALSYILRCQSGNSYFYIGDNSGASQNILSAAVPTGAWTLLVAWVDFAGGTINLQVNNGTVVSAAKTQVIPDDVHEFRIGGQTGVFWNGLIDDVWIFDRVLTVAERTAFYGPMLDALNAQYIASVNMALAGVTQTEAGGKLRIDNATATTDLSLKVTAVGGNVVDLSAGDMAVWVYWTPLTEVVGGGVTAPASYEVTHASLTAAALSETLILAAIPASTMIQTIVPIVTTPFAGGAISTVTATLGVPATMRAAMLADPVLAGHWSLDEVSGTRADSTTAANHLTDNNTVTQGAGAIGAAAQFTSANSEYLSHASAPALQAGDIDFAIFCTAWLDSTATAVMLVTKDAAGAGQREYLVAFDPSAGGRFYAGVFTAGDAANNLFWSAAPVAGTKYHIAVWYNAAANTLNMQINGAATQSLAVGPLQAASTGEFRIGARAYTGAESYMNGRIDDVWLLKRVPTAAELAGFGATGFSLGYDQYAAAIDLETAGAIQPLVINRVESTTAPVNLSLVVTTVGGNVADLTAGAVKFWVLTTPLA